jgi:PAS domain S-box-containing protein
LRYGIFSAEKMVLQGADCMMTVMVDITERKQAEEALRESEEKFRKIFDDGPVGMVMAGKDYRFIRVNAAFCRMLGYSASELTSLTFKDITHPEHLHEDSKSVMQVVNGEIPRYCTEKRYIRKDKETVWGALTLSAIRSNDGQLLYCLAMIEDITERKRAQEEKDRLQQQLQQSQKLEAIGTMAGGIAHDFNNILSAMLGFTELVRSEIPEDSESYENLTEVVRAGQRARDLVSQILSFTRKAQTEKSVISLVTIVSEALKFTRSIIPSHITIQQNFAVSAEHSILADPTQMHQIMLNLCINAADAMPDGGVLEISLEESQVQTENRPEQTLLPSGRYLKLTVRDSGVGMTPDVLERVFEPYFTTKQAGKGTGMGLAVVHGVVKEHGGNITVSSEVGKGTAVTVWLPVAEAASRTPVVSAPVITTGSGSILFVDDETVIVNLQRTQLNRWGYRVTATASSATALDMFRANPQGFDLVITDLTMPGITGIKLAEAIHEISPSTPIVLCTGFDEGISRENARMIGIRAILSKPISGAELSRTIRLVLDRAFESSPAKS